MALATPFVGSGEFVPELVWSCPVHDDDTSWSWDEDPWEAEGQVCLDCVTGQWRTVRDSSGSAVMRELSESEAGMRRWAEAEAAVLSAPSLLAKLLPHTGDGPQIMWLEDDLKG